jgi:hypothetical protein
MTAFKNFDDLFKATYDMYTLCGCTQLTEIEYEKLRSECKEMVLGLHMAIIEKLFIMHIRTEGEMLTPIDLYANILCLESVGEMKAQ